MARLSISYTSYSDKHYLLTQTRTITHDDGSVSSKSRAFVRISDRAKFVLYGLLKGKTMEELAETLHTTTDKIIAIHNEALKQLDMEETYNKMLQLSEEYDNG